MTSDNDSFEALLNASEEKPSRRLSPGQKTTATIVGVDGETIFLDVGLKSEGIVNASEFIDEHGEYPAGTWLRSPHMSKHFPRVEEETLIYVKVGYL